MGPLRDGESCGPTKEHHDYHHYIVSHCTRATGFSNHRVSIQRESSPQVFRVIAIRSQVKMVVTAGSQNTLVNKGLLKAWVGLNSDVLAKCKVPKTGEGR